MKTYANIGIVMLALAALIFSGCGQQKQGAPSGTPLIVGETQDEETQPVDTGQPAEPPKPTMVKKDLVLTTEDDVKISASLFELSKPAKAATEAVILIHQRGSDKEAWNEIVGKIVAKGYAVLAFDMRGHGKSTETTDGKPVGQPADGQWGECKKDAQAALIYLRNHGIKTVAIVGASVGASIAVYCASENDEVKGVIMLSPVIAIDPAVVQAAASLGSRKVFMYYSKDDNRGGNADSVKQFADQMANTPHEIHVFDGSDHGMAMLGKKYGDTDVDDSILKELDQILK